MLTFYKTGQSIENKTALIMNEPEYRPEYHMCEITKI